MRFILPFAGLALLLSSACFASQIERITLSELENKATHIVLGKVTKVVEDGSQDHVTIQVASHLKGGSQQDVFTFRLITRGGIKDFDPALRVGDSGVFFLKAIDEADHVEKAYWGSIATFPKDHFDLHQPQPTATPAEATAASNSLEIGGLSPKAICGAPTSVTRGMTRNQAWQALKQDGYPIDELDNRRAKTWHLRKSSAHGSPIAGTVCNIWVIFKKGVVESVNEGVISN